MALLKTVFTNDTVLDVLKDVCDGIKEVSPKTHTVLKAAAYMRHEAYKRIVEQDKRPIKDTWHGKSLQKVYGDD